MKKLNFQLLLLGALLTGGNATAALTRGPYLQLGTESSMVIVWRCDSVVTPVIKYGTALDALTEICPAENIVVRTTSSEQPLHSAPDEAVQYEATVTGLIPNTTYYYSIADAQTLLASASKELRFTTHPPIGAEKETRIWVVGDSGTGGDGQKAVFKAQVEYTQQVGRDIDLYVHLGDMAYTSGKDGEFQFNFFDIYETMLRNTVCWPTMGNHEGLSSKGFSGIGPYYDAYVLPTQGEAGGLPSSKEAYYSFDYGDIHFVCLNSFDLSRSTDAPMALWLKEDLKATQAKWLIAFWHHPPYTHGSHNSNTEGPLVDMRENFMPLLEAAGVDLVLTGHSHVYERSMLIDGAYHTPTHNHGVVLDDGDGNPLGDGAYHKSEGLAAHNGTVAIVAGHGGKLGRTVGMLPIMRTMIVEYGSVILDVKGNTLSGFMLDKFGKQVDPFQIVKQGAVEARALENPWTPTEQDIVRGKSLPAPRPANEAPFPERVPAEVKEMIAATSLWHYRTGSTFSGNAWAQLEADLGDWSEGPMGIGYGHKEANTLLRGMRKHYDQVQLRVDFELPKGTDLRRLGLAINYDDGFALYLNGKHLFDAELTRSGKVIEVSSHEAAKEEFFPLAKYAAHFKEGKNTLAIHGYNVNLNSSDFLINPRLVEVLPAN